MIFKESNHEDLFSYVVVVVVVASIVVVVVLYCIGGIVVTVFGLINVTDNTMLVPRRRNTKSKTTICLEVRNLFVPSECGFSSDGFSWLDSAMFLFLPTISFS